MTDMVRIPDRDARVVARSDVVVVGGGPAGLAAAIAAAREGASVTLLERYPYLGGMAAGGMVLLLDDMVNGQDITVRGLATEIIERMEAMGLAVTPPLAERGESEEKWARWARWGTFDYMHPGRHKPIVYATAFDPDGWKRAATDMLADAGVNLRLHSWFTDPIMEGDAIKGVISQTKSGPQAALADVVIDCTGDADVALASGAPTISGNYMITTVFRLGSVDTDEAERYEQAEPKAAEALNREAKNILEGSWALWWLKTPLPGIVWCNCPHMTGYDGTSVEDLTAADADGRKRIAALVEFARERLPGFAESVVVDVAPQIGIRQTRMIEGEYVVTKADVRERRHFPDSVARGRDYYTPYRALLPRGVEGLLVAGRHYSADPDAQKLSREIPPCMAMGEATGIAATMALERNLSVRDVDVAALQQKLRQRGADPGDVPADNASLPLPEPVS
jgi:glycine/D-amino acid oxidase-like deaminating enzyme